MAYRPSSTARSNWMSTNVAGLDEGDANGGPNSLGRSGTAPFRVFKLGLVDGEIRVAMMPGGYYILHAPSIRPCRESRPTPGGSGARSSSTVGAAVAVPSPG